MKVKNLTAAALVLFGGVIAPNATVELDDKYAEHGGVLSLIEKGKLQLVEAASKKTKKDKQSEKQPEPETANNATTENQ